MVRKVSAPALTFDRNADGVYVDLEALVSSRLLIQGSSGAGKSYLIRYLLEQTHGRIQQFVFDPEGEFSTLRERFDYVVASAGGDGDVRAHPDTADLLCRQLVELEASAILDIYELDPEEREEFVGRFLHRLVNMPKESWRSALVVVDEAHEYAPEHGKPTSRRPMELIVSKGRKRGLCAIYATQRLSKLSKNAADLQNMLIGYTGLDVDVRRAADVLGFDKGQSRELKQLEHEFLAFGPALSREVVRVQSGAVLTHHPKPGELRAPTPPAQGRLAELIRELEAIPDRMAEEEATVDELRAQIARLEADLRVARFEAVPLDEAEALAAERASQAVRQLRATVRPHVEALHHALANGSGPDAGSTAPEAPSPAPSTPARVPIAVSSPPRAPRPAPAGPAQRLPSAVTGPQQKVLDALATYESFGHHEVDRTAAIAMAGYKSGGHVNNVLGQLRSAGLIDYPSGNVITLLPPGRAVANAQPVRSRADIHARWFKITTGPQEKVLRVLIEAYPGAVAREDLAGSTGYSVGGHFNNVLGSLRTLGAIDYPSQGMVQASALLFPAGLR